jgi:hypothetical protein
MTEDSHSDAALVYILSGSLVTSQSSDSESRPERVLYTAFRASSSLYYFATVFALRTVIY